MDDLFTQAQNQARGWAKGSKMAKTKEPKSATELRGWQQIAQFLGQPMAVVQRWAKSGMPVHREGRSVLATPAELSEWLGREAHLKVSAHITSTQEDLIEDLKQSLRSKKKS